MLNNAVTSFNSAFPIDKRLVGVICFLALALEISLFFGAFVAGEPLLSIALLSGAVVAFAVFSRPEVGFLICVAMVFSAVSATYLGGLFRIVVFYTLIAYLIGVVRREYKFVADPLNVAILIFLALALFSLTYIKSLKLGLESLSSLLKSITLFILAANLVRSKQLLRLTFWLILLAATYVAAYNIVQAINDPLAFFHRIRGIFGDPNNLALVLVSVVPVAYGLFRIEEHWMTRLFVIACSMLIVLTAVATLSRGATIALGVVLLSIFYKERKNRLVLWGGLFIVTLGFWFLYHYFGLGAEMLAARFRSIDESFLQRYRLLKGGIAMFLAYPILGVGIGNFLVYSTHFTGLAIPLYAHNMFIHVAAELGVVAVILFVWILFGSLHRLQNVEREATGLDDKLLVFQARAVQLSLVALIVCGLFLSQQFNKILWLQLGLSTALAKMTYAHQNQATM